MIAYDAPSHDDSSSGGRYARDLRDEDRRDMGASASTAAMARTDILVERA
jgi:hypothetical protein